MIRVNKLSDKHRPVIEHLVKRFSTIRVKAEREQEVLHVCGKRLQLLGAGSFSSVYALDKDWAIRIEWNAGNNYATWAEFCIRNRGKHLPKIIFHTTVEDDDGYGPEPYCITVVERLGRLYDDDEETYDQWNNTCGRLESFLGGWGKTLVLPKMCKPHVSNPSMHRLAKQLKKANVYVNDLHRGNMMLRKCGTLVITDPVY